MKSIIGLTLTMFLAGCSGNESNQENIQNEKNTIEVKSQVIKKGSEITKSAQLTLSSRLKSSLEENGVIETISFCNQSAPQILDSLGDVYQVVIKRATLRVRNPVDSPNKIEEQLLGKYSAMIRQKKTVNAEAIMLEGGKFLYAEPIILNKPVCLQCHGDVSSEVRSHISKLYPNDQATGHTLGDLRGIWSVIFNDTEF